jgi:hypothetical protein
VSILADLVDKDFQTIDRKVILRNLSAAAGGGFSSESIDNLRKFNADQLKTAVEETREALQAGSRLPGDAGWCPGLVDPALRESANGAG